MRRASRWRSSTARRLWCGSRPRPWGPPTAVSSRANCWASSRARRARAAGRRTGGPRLARAAVGRRHAVAQEQVGVALERSQELELGGRAQLGAGEYPQRGARRWIPAGEPGRDRQIERVQESRREQLRAEVRAALAQQDAHGEVAVQTRERLAEIELPVTRSAHVVHARTCIRQLPLRGREHDDARVGILEQGDPGPEREAARDDARERLLAEAALQPQGAAGPIADEAAVALGAHRAGAHEHRVDGQAQGVEELAIGGAAETSRAALEGGAAVGGADHVEQHARPIPGPARRTLPEPEPAHDLGDPGGLAGGDQPSQPQLRRSLVATVDSCLLAHARTLASFALRAPAEASRRRATSAQHARALTCYGRGVWPGEKPAKAVQALAGRSSEQHPPRSSTHIPWRSSHMPTGTVKWFSDDKGFGFITPDDGDKDLFVHHTGINGEGYRSLQEGAKVSYDPEQGDKGPKAVNVQAI